MNVSPLPLLEIIDPAGRRRCVALSGVSDRVKDLAGALGLPPGAELSVGDRVVSSRELLVDIDELVTGVRIGWALGPDGTTGSSPEFEYAVIAGPSCTGWKPLQGGRHVVGRSPFASIGLEDQLVELHHAYVIVDDRGVRLVQLTGRTPIRFITGVDGDADATLAVDASIGASRLLIRRSPARGAGPSDGTPHTGGSVAKVTGDPWRREFRRAPSVEPNEPLGPIAAPRPTAKVENPSASSLIGAAVAAAGSVVAAVAFGQALFAVLALAGATAAVTTWGVGMCGAHRRRTRAVRAARAEAASFAAGLQARHRRLLDEHAQRHLDVVATLAALRAGDRIWCRRSHDDLLAVVGRGSCSLDLGVDVERDSAITSGTISTIERWSRLDDVAIPLTLRRGEAVALHGDEAVVRSLLRSVVVQLATWVGPADLSLLVVTADPPAWSWVNWLPHRRAGQRSIVIAPHELDRLADFASEPVGATLPDGRHTLIVVDEPSALSVRTGPLRRLMETARASTVVAVGPSITVPVMCRRTLEVSSTGRARWRTGSTDDLDVGHLQIAGIGEDVAESAALTLAPLIDPEDVDAAIGALEQRLTLGAVDPLLTREAPEEIVHRWNTAATSASVGAPIGFSADGVVEVDLVRDGPHALIAGTTGSGKSELLRTLVVSMAGQESPAALSFVLIDYKGGATFDCCLELPHIVGVVTDLDDGLAARALASLEAELSRREREFRAAGVAEIGGYRQLSRSAHPLTGLTPIARLVVVIDEFATLARDLPDFLAALVGIAQRGRSLGVHLVLATQRPGGVVSDDIRANTNLRIALRVNDRADALDVVAAESPAQFSRLIPGRAAIRLGHDELITFQAARCTGALPTPSDRLRVDEPPTSDDVHDATMPASETELSVAVRVIRDAAQLGDFAPPRRPWLEPLPLVLDPGVVEQFVAASSDGAVGLIDDPSGQAMLPLRWDPTTGNLMLVGALGSGLTTTVISLVTAICRSLGPEQCHVYVIDGVGERVLDQVALFAHCGGVVRIVEHERIARLLGRLSAEIDRRVLAGSVGREPLNVLCIDGLPELRRSLDSIERLESLARLDRILDAGAAVGVVCCATAEDATKGAAGSMTMSVAERWVFAGPPGRLRLASSGLLAQVAIGAPPAGSSGPSEGIITRVGGLGPAEITVLGTRVDAASMPASGWSNGEGRRSRRLVVGIGADDLDPNALVVPAGEHILVGGAGRTGKSTALRRLASAWSEIDGPASVRWWHELDDGAIRELLDATSPTTLLVVDDADRLDGADGAIADLVRDPRRRVTIAAAARIESVRSAYGHWIRDVARNHCGLLLTSAGDIDGELLGAVLPRRPSIAARPGLAWVVDGSGHRLVQVADRMRP